MTRASLRALLEGAIDYAGMFPPAGLPLHEAIAEYRARLTEPAAWLLGRFVCPATQLRDLVAVFGDRGAIFSLTVPVTYTREGDIQEVVPVVLFTSLAAGGSTKHPGMPPRMTSVTALEFRWQVNAVRDTVLARPENLLSLAVALTHVVNPEAKMYFELSRVDSPAHASAVRRLLDDTVRQLATHNAKGQGGNARASAGFKLRCGGAAAADIPSLAEVAGVICACRNARIFWKATAGLHHPLRHVDAGLGVPVHGFVNLFTAAVMADVHRLDASRIEPILADEDPSHFRFGDDALTWRDLSATCEQIALARGRGLQSFGSCSIEEPIQDLKALGWL